MLQESLSHSQDMVDLSTGCDTLSAHRLQLDSVDEKRWRAADRLRGLQKKRAEYKRWLQKGNGCQKKSAGKPVQACSDISSMGDHRAKAHRSARAQTRTCLAKGAVEIGSDMPIVSMGRAGKWKRWARKPSVSPMLHLPVSGRRQEASPTLKAWMELVADPSVDLDMDAVEESAEPETSLLSQMLPSFSCMEDAIVAICQEGEAQVAGVLALGRLAYSDARKAAQIGDREGVEMILDIMRARPQQFVVQQACCLILAAVTASGPSGRAQVASGSIEALVSAMHTLPDAADIQENCCQTLKELAAQDAETREKVLRSSALSAVLTAMRRHSANPRIQIAALGVVRNVSAGSSENQGRLASNGAAQRTLYAMALHSKDAGVQCAGCWALFCITVQNRALQWDVAGRGGIHAVLAGMKSHVAMLKVQEAGCYALRELAGTVVSDVDLWLDMVHTVSRALRECPAAELQKAGQAARQRLASRGVRRIYASGSQLVEPSIVKRRRLTGTSLPVITESE
mmetsp:Transcript_66742/g.118072  ORF Transcript_66742/g.118072 Transcript_66742/m.118072 type:complete len:513 (-) Transcript_66742:71-1609(-)|eukprot:CAMPEP_0197631542 /NCGR_PEP_ID=MMETSP1338-20131121/8672_1 /TAXON_ID=43686 ORGANISM="Pelagodinium beii, Strain RCC1491" /NCGR_SAMPLE_ID=MMETSP1338 /ASSEMBLY_ACC=CAM_ASM_000754 /LENGTH=512 /DNA_ID=CAMNT_0043203017 /DNA_START=119 /DNA_END=1657 /DNA_ORIENTATION=-